MNRYKAIMRYMRSWISCHACHRFWVFISLIMLFLSLASPVRSEEKSPKRPISLEQIEQEFAAARSESRPVKIENRIIAESALDYLNHNLSDGPGIHIENCKIEGDLNFVKHARTELERLSDAPEIRRRANMIRQEIRFINSEIHGSLIGVATRKAELEVDIAIFMYPIDFSESIIQSAIFRGGFWYLAAIFQKNADFRKVKFIGEADFGCAQFMGKADFAVVKFSQEADFWGTKFSQEAYFSGAEFMKRADFSGTNFEGDANFIGALFHEIAIFESKFRGSANFSDARFRKPTDFCGAKFSQIADFSRAEFDGETEFWTAEFGGNVSFVEAKFAGKIRLNWVQFSKKTSFREAVFDGHIDFSGSNFGGITSFSNTRFLTTNRIKAPIRFDLCTFGGKTDFTNAIFQQAVIFSSSIMKDELCFNYVRLSDNLDFSGICLFGKQNGSRGALSFVGMRGNDIFFGISQPSIEPPELRRDTLAVRRAVNACGQQLHDELEPGCSIDLTGSFYSRILFLDWAKLEPAIDESLKKLRQRTSETTAPERTSGPAPSAGSQEKSANTALQRPKIWYQGTRKCHISGLQAVSEEL